MIFEPVSLDGLVIGMESYHGSQHFFFGNRAAQPAALRKRFPEYAFRELKQVHGRDVRPATAHLSEADGHFTSAAHEALCIKTADCLPILLAGTTWVAALHAGWRGLQNGIIEVAAARMRSPAQIAAIGPHIQTASFEVDQALGQEFERSYQRLAPKDGTSLLQTHPQNPDEKVLVNLALWASVQLMASMGLPKDKIYLCPDDTFASPQFHSYRRDREQAGRMWHFIAQT